MTKKTNEPSGWNPVFEFPLDDRNTIIIDGVKYKRVEEPKTPAEEAFKKVYGAYPPTTPSVSSYEDNRWSAFQNGYNAAYEEKVSQEPEEEPEELKTLYQMFENEGAYGQLYYDDALKVVKSWMSQYADNVLCGECKKGYEYCLTVLEENLKND